MTKDKKWGHTPLWDKTKIKHAIDTPDVKQEPDSWSKQFAKAARNVSTKGGPRKYEGNIRF